MEIFLVVPMVILDDEFLVGMLLWVPESTQPT